MPLSMWVRISLVYFNLSQTIIVPLSHFNVPGVQGSSKRIFALFALDIDVSHKLLLTREDDFGLISEIDLDDFVAEPEHDCVTSLHPFLDVAEWSLSWLIVFISWLDLGISIEVVSEVLK